MIEPLISLAFSVQANKGVYALLLGSGISRAAGIPTGWEVVEDLIKKVAHAKGQKCIPDAETWYRATFDEEPNYSKLLNTLAKSPPERNQILKDYFEANEEERARNLKVPTIAHRAVADLAASGHLRIIVTTNFDRLMERALELVGIVPTVIDSPDKIEGAIPLIHSHCTIIKLHGDYMDIRIKNTPEELAQYDERMNKVLDRVLDDYGLLVCGWSADYDTALEAAISRCQSRRYTTYWTYRDNRGEAARRLIALRDAQVIKIEGADQFFSELAEKVSALEELASPHPLTIDVAVATAKKYLMEEKYRIQLADMLTRETTRLLEATSDDFFPPNVQIDETEFKRRIARYEAQTEILLRLMITGCYWSQSYHKELWLRTLKRVANPFGDFTRTTRSVRDGLSWYPALLLMYGGGIAAVAAEKYDNLAALLLGTTIKVVNEREMLPAAYALEPLKVFDNIPVGRWLQGVQLQNFAVSEYLNKLLKYPLAEILPQADEYDRCFDRFEYLLALVYADLQAKKYNVSEFFAAGGLFASEPRMRYQTSEQRVQTKVKEEADRMRDDWAPLKAGLFDGLYERFNAVATGFEAENSLAPRRRR
jgi:hypothetical protein